MNTSLYIGLPELNREKASMANSLEKVLRDTPVSLKVLRMLTEGSYDSILITEASAGAKIIYANQAFRKLTGYAPSEVIGKTPRILQGPATDRRVIARLTEVLKSGGKFEGQAINYRKDGTPFIMYWRVLPVEVRKQLRFWVAIQREGFVIQ